MILMAAALPASAALQKWFVDPSKAQSGDGRSWSTAFRTLEEGLTQAAGFDTVFLAKGTYVPAGDPATQSVGYELKQGLVLMGGYPGNGGARDIALNPTILSGDKGRDDVYDDDGYRIIGANFRHILHYDAAASDPHPLHLDGLSVMGGDAGNDGGSALSFGFGNLILKDCKFIGHRGHGGAIQTARYIHTLLAERTTFRFDTSTAAGGAMDVNVGYGTWKDCHFLDNAAGVGGAMSLTGFESVAISGVFRNNSALWAGALRLNGKTASITNSEFTRDTASTEDGGAVTADLRSLTVTHTVFADCKAELLGGALRFKGNDLAVSYTTFAGNSAKEGGGMLAYADGLALDSLRFAANRAQTKGGALSFGSDGTLARSAFIGNVAETGGAIFGGANSRTVGFRVRTSVFEGNSAASGGAVAFDKSLNTLDSCQFRGNRAAAGGGGVSNLSSSELQITASAFTGNTADQGGALSGVPGFPVTLLSVTLRENRARLGGAVTLPHNPDSRLDRCAFLANAADSGAAIYGFDGVVANSVLAGNTARLAGTVVGASGSGYNTLRQYFNDYSGNRAAQGGGGCLNCKGAIQGCIFWDNSLPPLDKVDWTGVTRNVIQGFDAQSGGNFAADPKWTDPAGFDFRLRSSSTLINAFGTVPPEAGSLDFLGQPRAYGPADIGAVEFQGEPYSAPVLLSRLNRLSLLPGKPYQLKLDSVGAAGDPLYVRFSGSPSAVVFAVMKIDPAVQAVYDPGRQILTLTASLECLPGDVKFMTLRAVHPTRSDLFDEKKVSLEIGKPGFNIRSVSLVQDNRGLFEGRLQVTDNAYPIQLAAGRLYLGQASSLTGLDSLPYLRGIQPVEIQSPVSRGGENDPGEYRFVFNGATAMVYGPGDRPLGKSLADWASIRPDYRAKKQLRFLLPITDGIETPRLVAAVADCRLDRPTTALSVVDRSHTVAPRAFAQTVRWEGFAVPIDSLELAVEPLGPGAGPSWSRRLTREEMEARGVDFDGLEDARSYRYRLVATDRMGLKGTSEAVAATPSGDYVLSGRVSGTEWARNGGIVRIKLEEKSGAAWRPVDSMEYADSVPYFTRAHAGVTYRVSISAAGVYPEPGEYVFVQGRADKGGLDFRLTTEPVIAHDSASVEQFPGSGLLRVEVRTSQLYVSERPAELLLRWEGGFPERHIDSQWVSIQDYQEQLLGQGRALWVMYITREAIDSLILGRTRSFDRDVRYLGCRVVTSAFSFPRFRSAPFDFPVQADSGSAAFAAQIFAKPGLPQVGKAVAGARDATLSIAASHDNPGLRAVVTLTDKTAGGTQAATFPMQGEMRGSASAEWIQWAPGDEDYGGGGLLHGIAWPASAGEAILRTMRPGRYPVSARMEFPDKGKYRIFAHISAPAKRTGTLCATFERWPERTDSLCVPIGPNAKGWVSLGSIPIARKIVRNVALGMLQGQAPWIDALASSRESWLGTATAPAFAPAALPAGWRNPAQAIAQGFSLLPEHEYEAEVVVKDAYGNVSDTLRQTFTTLGESFAGNLIVHQDTGTGDVRFTLPPSGQDSLSLVRLRFSFGDWYDFRFNQRLPPFLPQSVSIARKDWPAVLADNAAFTYQAKYYRGEIELQRETVLLAADTLRTLALSCSDCSGRCLHSDFNLLGRRISYPVCETVVPRPSQTASSSIVLPFLWPDTTGVNVASQHLLRPKAPSWRLEKATAHSLALREPDMNLADGGWPLNQMSGHLDVTYTPGTCCEDSSRVKFPFVSRFGRSALDTNFILSSPTFDASAQMQVGAWRSLGAGGTGPSRGVRHQWIDAKPDGQYAYGGFFPNSGDSVTRQELFSSPLERLPRLAVAVRVDSGLAGSALTIWMLPAGVQGLSSRRIHLGLDGAPLPDGEVSLTGDGTAWVKGPSLTVPPGDHDLDLFMLEDGASVAGLALGRGDDPPAVLAADLPRWGEYGFEVKAMLDGLPPGTDITLKTRAVDRFGNASKTVVQTFRTLERDAQAVQLNIAPLDTMVNGFFMKTTPAFDVSAAQEYPDSLGLDLRLQRVVAGLATTLPAPRIEVMGRNHWKVSIDSGSALPAYPDTEWVSLKDGYRIYAASVGLDPQTHSPLDTGDASMFPFGIRSDSASVPLQPALLKHSFQLSPHVTVSWLQGLEIDSTTLIGDLEVAMRIKNTELPGQRIILRNALVEAEPLLDSATGKVISDSVGNRWFTRITGLQGGTLDLELCALGEQCQSIRSMTLPMGRYMARFELDSLSFAQTADGPTLSARGMKVRDDKGNWTAASGDDLIDAPVTFTSLGMVDSVYAHEGEFHIAQVAGGAQGEGGFGLTACRAAFKTTLTDSGPSFYARLAGPCDQCGPYLEYRVHDAATGDSAYFRRDGLMSPVELSAIGYAPYSMRTPGAPVARYQPALPDTVPYGGFGIVQKRYAFDSTGVTLENFDLVLPKAVFPDSLNPSGAALRGLGGIRIVRGDSGNGRLVWAGLARPAANADSMTLAHGHGLRMGQPVLAASNSMGQPQGLTLFARTGTLTLHPAHDSSAFEDESPLPLALDSLSLYDGQVAALEATGSLDRDLRKPDAGRAVRVRAPIRTHWLAQGLDLEIGSPADDTIFALDGEWFGPARSIVRFPGLIQVDAGLQLRALEGEARFGEPKSLTPNGIAGLLDFGVSGVQLRVQDRRARLNWLDPTFDLIQVSPGDPANGAGEGNALTASDVTTDAGGNLATFTAALDVPKGLQSVPGWFSQDFASNVFDLRAERLSLGVLSKSALRLKAKGALILGDAFHALGLEGMRLQVDDFTVERNADPSGFTVQSVHASINNEMRRFVLTPGKPWVEILTAGGDLSYSYQVDRRDGSGLPVNELAVEGWSVGFTKDFPIEDLKGLRLLIDKLAIDAKTGGIIELTGAAEYRPPQGELRFPGFTLLGVNMKLGAEGGRGYASLHFDGIRVGADTLDPANGERCTTDGRIYFDGDFAFDACFELKARIPIYPPTDVEADQQVYILAGEANQPPTLVRAHFDSEGKMQLSLEHGHLVSRDEIPVLERRLDAQVNAQIGYDAANRRFTVGAFEVKQDLEEDFSNSTLFNVKFKTMTMGYSANATKRVGTVTRTGDLFYITVDVAAGFDQDPSCAVGLEGSAGVLVKVDSDPDIRFTFGITGSADCKVQGFRFVMDGIRIEENRVGFEAAALSLDNLPIKLETQKDPGVVKPGVLRANAEVRMGAYFEGWYVTRVPGSGWSLQYGTAKPTFKADLTIPIMGQDVKAEIDFMSLFSNHPEILFRRVRVKLNDKLGGSELPTGWRFKLDMKAPYLHAAFEAPKSVVLALPEMKFGSVGLKDALLELGLAAPTQGGDEAWYFRGKAALTLPNVINGAEAEIEFQEPSKINATGLRKARVLIRLAAGARIPLGTTGLYIAGFEGAIYDGDALPEGAIACDIFNLPPGLKMEAAMLIEYQKPEVANGDLGFWLHLQALNLGVNGNLKMLKGIADAQACIALYRGGTALHGKFQIEAEAGLAMRGLFVVDIWTDNDGANLTSTAAAEIGLKRGALFKSCWLKIPSRTKYFGGVTTKLGKFETGDNGFTGGVRFLGKTWGVGVIGGSFKLGNVGKYRLKQAPLLGQPAGGGALRKMSSFSMLAAPGGAAAPDTVPGIEMLSLGLRVQGDEVIGVVAAADSGGGLPDTAAANADMNSHNTWPADALRLYVRTGQSGPYELDVDDGHYLDPVTGESPAAADPSENTLTRVWRNPIATAGDDYLALAVPRMPEGRDREKYEYQIFAGLRAPEMRLIATTGSDDRGSYVQIDGSVGHFQSGARILERSRPDGNGGFVLDTLFKLEHEMAFGIGQFEGEASRAKADETKQYGLNTASLTPDMADGAPTAARNWIQVPGVGYDPATRTLGFTGVKIRPKLRSEGRYAFRAEVLSRDYCLVSSIDNGQPETRRHVLPDSERDSASLTSGEQAILRDRDGNEAVLTVTSLDPLASPAPFTATGSAQYSAPWAGSDTLRGDETRTVFLRWNHPKSGGPIGYRLTVIPAYCGAFCASWEKKQFALGPSSHYEMRFLDPQKVARRDCRNATGDADHPALACGEAWLDTLAWYEREQYHFILTPVEGKWDAAGDTLAPVERNDLALAADARFGYPVDTYPDGAWPASLSLSLPAGDTAPDGLPIYRVARGGSDRLAATLTTVMPAGSPQPQGIQYGEASIEILDGPGLSRAEAGLLGPKVGAQETYFPLQVATAPMTQDLPISLSAQAGNQTCGDLYRKRCPNGDCRADSLLLAGPCQNGLDELVRRATPKGRYRARITVLQSLGRRAEATPPAATVQKDFYVDVTDPVPVLKGIEPDFVHLDKIDTLRIAAGGLDADSLRAGRYVMQFSDSAGLSLGDSTLRFDSSAYVIVRANSFRPALQASQQVFANIALGGLKSKSMPLDAIRRSATIECQDTAISNRIDRNNSMAFIGIYPRYVGIARSPGSASDTLSLRISQATELNHRNYGIILVKSPGGDTIPIPEYTLDRDGVRFVLPDTVSEGHYLVEAISRNPTSLCKDKGASARIVIYTKRKPAWRVQDDEVCLTNVTSFRKYQWLLPWEMGLSRWRRATTDKPCVTVPKSDQIGIVTTDIDGNNPDTTRIRIVRDIKPYLADRDGARLGDTLIVGQARGPIRIVNPEGSDSLVTARTGARADLCYRLNRQAEVCGEPTVRLRPNDRGTLAIWTRYTPYDGSSPYDGPVRYILLLGPLVQAPQGVAWLWQNDILPFGKPLPGLLLPDHPATVQAKRAYLPTQQPVGLVPLTDSARHRWLTADSLPIRERTVGLTTDTVPFGGSGNGDSLLAGAGTPIPGRMGSATRVMQGEAVLASMESLLPAADGRFTWQSWLRCGDSTLGSWLRYEAMYGVPAEAAMDRDGRVHLRIGLDSAVSLPGVVRAGVWQHVALSGELREGIWSLTAYVNAIPVARASVSLVYTRPTGGGIVRLLAVQGEPLDYELMRWRREPLPANALLAVYRSERDRRDAFLPASWSPEVRWQRDVQAGDAYRSDDAAYVLQGIDASLIGGDIVTLPVGPWAAGDSLYRLHFQAPADVHALFLPQANLAQAWLGAFSPAGEGADFQNAADGETFPARHYSMRILQDFDLEIPKSTANADLPVFVVKPRPGIPPVRVSALTPLARVVSPLRDGSLPYADREDSLSFAAMGPALAGEVSRSVLISLPAARRADTSASALSLSLAEPAMLRVVVPKGYLTADDAYLHAPWRKVSDWPAQAVSDGIPRAAFEARFGAGAVNLPGLRPSAAGVPSAAMMVLASRNERPCLFENVDPAYGATDCLAVGEGMPADTRGTSRLTALPQVLQGSQAIVPHRPAGADTLCFTLARTADIIVAQAEGTALPRALASTDTVIGLGAFEPLYAAIRGSDSVSYRLYRRGAISGRNCLDLSPLGGIPPIVFGRHLPASRDSGQDIAIEGLVPGSAPFAMRPDVQVIALPSALEGARYLPVASASAVCDTEALSLGLPGEAFVAFEGSPAFELYLLSEGWRRAADPLIAQDGPETREMTVYHRLFPYGGAQLPGRACFEKPPRGLPWLLALKPMPGLRLGLKSEKVRVALTGPVRAASAAHFNLKDIDVSFLGAQKASNPDFTLKLSGAPSPVKAKGITDTLRVWSPYLDTVRHDADGRPVRIRPYALLPDLMPTWVDAESVQVSRSTLQVSGFLRIDVQNRSDAAAYRRFAILAFHDVNGDFRYEAGVDSLLGRSLVMGLLPHETATYQLALAGQVPQPTRTFMALADADGFIAESVEDNNSAASRSICGLAAERSGNPAPVDTAWLRQRLAQFPVRDSVLRRDVAADPDPEWVLPFGVMSADGQVLLKAATCDEWRNTAADSLRFDFDGDGFLETLGCQGQTVTVRDRLGTLLATLGGGEPSLKHRLTDFGEAAAQACYDGSLSYPRLDTSGYAATGNVRITLRVANGGESAQDEIQSLTYYVWGTNGWIQAGAATQVSGLVARSYADVSQTVDLSALPVPANAPVILRAVLGDGAAQRDIDRGNQSIDLDMEALWP